MTNTTEKTKPVFTDDELREIREKCAEIKTEAEAPLPEGDVGLIEAERRLVRLRARYARLDRVRNNLDREEATEPYFNAAWGTIVDLSTMIQGTAPEGWAGVQAKLRNLLNPEGGMAQWDECAADSLQQIADFIGRRDIKLPPERRAPIPLPAWDADEVNRILDRDPPLESRYLFMVVRFEPRLNNALTADGYAHPDQLLSLTDREMERIINVGPKGIAQIKEWQQRARAMGRQPMPIYRDETGRRA